MIAPSDKDKRRINNPDAVFFQKVRQRALVTHELLHKVIDGRKRANGAPETSQEQENNRDNRPPEHPGQGGAQVFMRCRRPQHQLVDDHRENNKGRPLNSAGIPAAAQKAVDPQVFQEIPALKTGGSRFGRLRGHINFPVGSGSTVLRFVAEAAQIMRAFSPANPARTAKEVEWLAATFTGK